jgi:uncharacterized membrane protein
MSDPNQLKLTTGGGGILTLFGLPFLAAGLFVLVAPAFGVVIHSEGGGEAPAATRFLLGGLFSLIGAAIAFGRAGVILDRSREEASFWWGLLIPLKRRTRPLSDFELVALHREVRTTRSSNGGSQSYTVFPVRLRATQGEDEELSSPRSRQPARAQAERVAKFLDFGMADATGEGETVRAAGTLDHSLREQLRDDPPPVPQQPNLGEGRYETEGRTAVIELPAPGFLRAGGLGAGLGFVVPVVCMGGFMAATGFFSSSGGPIFAGFLGLVVLCAALPLVGVAAVATTRERLRVSPDGVDVERHGPLTFGRRSQHVAMDELEEVAIVRPARQRSIFGARTRVALQGDEATVTVGSGLDHEAQAWLRDLIRYVAAHGSPPAPARV